MVDRKFPTAQSEFQRAIQLRGDFSLAYFLLGITQAVQKQFTAALPNVKKVTSLEPNEPLAWMLVSECQSGLGHKQEAVEPATRATTVSRAFLSAWLQLARAEKDNGDPHACLRAGLRGADLSPDSAYMLATV